MPIYCWDWNSRGKEGFAHTHSGIPRLTGADTWRNEKPDSSQARYERSLMEIFE